MADFDTFDPDVFDVFDEEVFDRTVIPPIPVNPTFQGTANVSITEILATVANSSVSGNVSIAPG